MLNYSRIVTGWAVALLTLGTSLARADDQLVTLKYVGTDVRKAIGMLQTVSDLRVAIDPRVPSKRITLSLKDLPPEDALRTVVASAGLTCRKVGNAFLVEPRPAKPRDGATGKAAAAGDKAAAGGDRPAAGVPLLMPRLGGGIIQPNAPGAMSGAGAERESAVTVPPAVLAALEQPVDVDVKNGPLSAVTEQLSKSAGIKVSADPMLSEGLVATVGLHGIPMKAALELVAGQTGLQISPRPDGVAFVQAGLSLDRVQAQRGRAPAGVIRVDQGQLWTAEWANALTSGISGSTTNPAPRSLRRQTLNGDDHALEFKPRSGNRRSAAASPAPRGNAAGVAPTPRESVSGPASLPSSPHVTTANASRKATKAPSARKGKVPAKIAK